MDLASAGLEAIDNSNNAPLSSQPARRLTRSWTLWQSPKVVSRWWEDCPRDSILIRIPAFDIGVGRRQSVGWDLSTGRPLYVYSMYQVLRM